MCECPSPVWAVLLVVAVGAAFVAHFLRLLAKRLGRQRWPRAARLVGAVLSLGVGVIFGWLGYGDARTLPGLCMIVGCLGAVLGWLPALVEKRAPVVVDAVVAEVQRITGQPRAVRSPTAADDEDHG